MPRSATSLLFGDAALTLACAEILLARGHRLAVWTGDPRLAAWCAERRVRIRYEVPGPPVTAAAVAELAGPDGCDFIWSVHNVRLLPPEVLALPRRLAVNFHDALLPRYAGLHATTWARLALEREQGVTWHRLEPGIDTGELLLQRRFPVAEDDTAWTLNLRAAAAASESFPELLEGILAGTLAPRRQALERRTYFAGHRQPSPGCVIPWGESAERVVAFVRALDFGVADSPLALPKLLAPGGILLAARIERVAGNPASAPGTVVALEGSAVTVATLDGLVRFPELHAAGGGATSAPLGELELARAGVVHGAVLPSAAPEPEALAALLRELRPHERFWSERLLDLAPLFPPELDAEPRERGGSDLQVETALPSAANGPPLDESLVLAALLDGLARTIGQPFDVALGEPEWRQRLAQGGAHGFVVDRPPLRVDRREGETLAEFARRIAVGREEIARRGGFAIDLARRTRRLREPGRAVTPAIAVDLGGERRAEGRERSLFAEGEPRLALALGAGGRVVWTARGVDRRKGEILADFAAGVTAAAAAALRDSQKDAAPLPAAPAGALLSELFRRAAAAHPDAIAIEVEGERTSYAELALRVERLAQALRRRGAGGGREWVVALLADRLLDVATGMLAALDCGAAFAVVDPRDPPARQRELCDEIEPWLVLARSGIASPRPEIPRHPFALAEHDELPAAPPAPPPRPEALALLAFTSGTSGPPKAVAIEQRALAHYLRTACAHFALAPGDRLLQLGSWSFDLAYEQIFGALCSGATLVGRSAGAAVAGEELLASAARLRISVLDLPTIVWERTAASFARGATLPPSLRLAIAGGDRASVAATRAWRRAAGDRLRLVNTYGPTEATIVATWWEIPDASSLALRESIPIGVPVAGVSVRVLDEEGRAVGPGEPGELWLGGPGLARGYYRRPAATRERFREVAATPGERLYRTGDRVARNAAGELEYLGRLDRQVKIAGVRVEPEAIESLLAGLDGVAEAAVGAIDRDGAVRLAAWYVPAEQGGGASSAGALTARLERELGERLPAPMRPATLAAVDRLPRLAASGKVDFRALVAAVSVAAAPAEIRPPETLPVELRWLAELFSRAIGVEVRSARDDFFSLGGDSLAAVSLLAAIEEECGVALPVDALVRSPTVERLAAAIAERGGHRRTSALVPMDDGLRSGAPVSGRAPLYCVHGLGGHLLRLVDLARQVAPVLPFFGLQCPGLDDGEAIPATIEELAARFLVEVRRHGPPAAPLQLCGMSFGGFVALEMARQARAAGWEPSFVGLFDSEVRELLPRGAPRPPAPLDRGREAVRRFLGDWLGRARRRLRRARAGRDEVQRPNEYRHFTRVQRANDRALLRYGLPAYSGRVTFFAATPRPAGVYEELAQRTGADLEVVAVPGDHLSMLEPPQVAVLAAELLRRLA